MEAAPAIHGSESAKSYKEAVMGFLKFADAAMAKAKEYTPQVRDFLETVEKKSYERMEREMDTWQECERYKDEYSRLSTKDLQRKLNEESGLRKKAIVSLLQERNHEMMRYKELYSGLSTIDLKLEMKMLEHGSSGYGDLCGRQLSKVDADMRKRLIVSILRNREE